MPRSSLTTTFSVSDANNEVICPLKNQDGSTCRKRCFGEKRFRSMQEHIRRAHPAHYISKLPATQESFNLMVNTPPSQKSIQNGSPISLSTTGYEPNTFFNHNISPTSPVIEHAKPLRRPSMLPAAAALAELHNSRPEPDWTTEQDSYGGLENDSYLHNYFASPGPPESFDALPIGDSSPPFPIDVVLKPLARTPSGRASSLQPLPRTKGNRSRKSSVTENARKPKHERERSRDITRLSLGFDRKAALLEASSLAAFGSKWEDLLDAAASATEEDSHDLTPIPQSPHSPLHSFPQHPQFHSYAASPLQNSILPRSPEPDPTFTVPILDPFPSVEVPTFNPQPLNSMLGNGMSHQTYQHHHHHHHSSNESANSNPFATYSNLNLNHHQHQHHSSGSSFHIPPSTLSSSSPHILNHHENHVHNDIAYSEHQYSPVQHTSVSSPPAPPPPLSPPLVQHYCAACHRVAPLTSSYACTECICGICRDCVDVLVGMGPERGARCPRCKTVSGRWKPFMLDLR